MTLVYVHANSNSIAGVEQFQMVVSGFNRLLSQLASQVEAEKLKVHLV